jgi:hypothetical protein
VAANDIWAVGWALTSAEILHWDGQAWTFSPTGFVGNYASFYGVAAIAPNDVWALAAPAGPWPTIGTGSAWNIARTPNPGRSGNLLYGGAALGANDVWAVGQSLDSAWRTLAMHWDGTHWRTVKTPNPGTGEFATNVLNGACAIALDDVWAVGVGQQAMTIHWNGRHWREIPNPGAN